MWSHIGRYDIEGCFFVGNPAKCDGTGNMAEDFFMIIRLYQPEERMYRGEYACLQSQVGDKIPAKPRIRWE